jgi:cyclophilin family peptidyl-prolyl cis-trans isomerase
MRHRLPILMSLSCALLLAVPVFAQDAAAPAAPAETTKAAATTKPAAKPAAPATADAAIKAIDAQIAKAAPKKAEAGWRTKLPMPTAVKFDASKQYLAHMVTNKGEIVLKLMPDVAPLHVTNFIYLARMGFYDGLIFHRVIPGFMAQGGCPLGTGTGNPGYGFNGEFSPAARHSRPGMLSTANAGPGTDGSQFFITFVPTGYLDGKHTIYGEVASGMDVLKAIEAKGSPSGATSEKLSITKVTIEVK